MEEPAFAPRETIVNTSAPAVARDAEILSPEKLVHSTRGKIAAISAPPEQLPLTENPAIGKRDELELDELIPNTSPVVEALPAAEATAPSTRATAPSVEKKKHIGLIAVILGGAIVLLAVGLTWWTQT